MLRNEGRQLTTEGQTENARARTPKERQSHRGLLLTRPLHPERPVKASCLRLTRTDRTANSKIPVGDFLADVVEEAS